MILSLTSTLALFVLIALSTAIFFAAKRFHLPYTILLVFVGMVLVPISQIPYIKPMLSFLDDLSLTPDLLFFIFLPVLIFESGFNMDIRKMLDNAWIILSLAIISLVIAAAIIGGLIHWILPSFGVAVPLIVALIFGAIISSTDPVAVLALFKEMGVPRRLAMIFEGESLINDGTAVALFLTLLAIASNGFHGTETVLSGFLTFVVMLGSGVVVGLVLAALFSRAVSLTRSNEFVTVTLLIIAAHLIFIIAEVINHLGYFHVSPIIATTVGSLFLGNYTRYTLTPKLDEYTSKLIEHITFIVNSLVFLLAGILFVKSGANWSQLWLPVLVTVFIVAFARMVAIFSVLVPLNKTGLEEHIPTSWIKLLSWGGLRGALAIIMILTIPEDFTVEGWEAAYSVKDFLLSLTIGCILATLFIKAPTIGFLMRRFGITAADPLREAYQADLSVFYLLTERERLFDHYNKGFINQEQHERLLLRVEEKLRRIEHQRQTLIEANDNTLFMHSLHISFVQIEIAVLKRLYLNNEVSEKTYRRIYSKLAQQQEKIEYIQSRNINSEVYISRKNIFESLVDFSQSLLSRGSTELSLEERLQYYRAQMIMARKALLTVERMQEMFDQPIFTAGIYEEVRLRYTRYMEQCSKRVDALVEENEAELRPYLAKLAELTLATSGNRALEYLYVQGLVNEEKQEDILQQFRA